MKFIVDAQLPRILVTHLIALGHEAVHVKDLPEAGGTSDAEIIAFADVNDRIVVTKDADFRHTHEAAGRPERLLYIRTGHPKPDSWPTSRPITPRSPRHSPKRTSSNSATTHSPSTRAGADRNGKSAAVSGGRFAHELAIAIPDDLGIRQHLVGV